MKRTIYIFTSGNLKREGNTLVLVTEAGKKAIPVETIEDIFRSGLAGKDRDFGGTSRAAERGENAGGADGYRRAGKGDLLQRL